MKIRRNLSFNLTMVALTTLFWQIETQALDDQDMLDAAPDLEETKSRLAEAADALRRLTMNGIKPSRLRSQWPDIVQRAEEAYGWTAERMRPPRPELDARPRF